MHKLFEISIEIFGWIQIVLSPTLIGIRFVLVFITFILIMKY